MEKFKIVSNESGTAAKLYIDGKFVKDVRDIRVSCRQPNGLRLKLTKNKRGKDGNYKLNKQRAEILTELVTCDFPEVEESPSIPVDDDFSKYMNEPED